MRVINDMRIGAGGRAIGIHRKPHADLQHNLLVKQKIYCTY